MANLVEQLKRMVKTTHILREGIEDNEELDLAEIDRGLNIAIDKQTDEVVNELLGKK